MQVTTATLSLRTECSDCSKGRLCVCQRESVNVCAVSIQRQRLTRLATVVSAQSTARCGFCSAEGSEQLAVCVNFLSTLWTPFVGQWLLYVPYSGHYMYRTVVTICTVQWSLYVPYSGHYVYRAVVTICTVQWSICTVQWSLYVLYIGHYMYRTVVSICTASLTFNNSTFCPLSVFMCFVWI